MTESQYCVAGFFFSLSLPDGQDADRLLPSFRPFLCEKKPQEESIFQLTVCAARKSFSKSARLAMLGKLIANTFQEALILLRLFLDRGLRRSKTLLIFSKFKLIGKLKRNPLNFLVKKTYLQAFLQQLRQQSYYDYQ